MKHHLSRGGPTWNHSDDEEESHSAAPSIGIGCITLGPLRTTWLQRLDVLVYPSWNNPPRLLGDPNTPDRSTGPRIASVVGFPAITIPMGYVQNAALPVGIEILGNEWSEPRLIEIAYAYEQATRHRKPPPSAPPLGRDLRRQR